MSLASTISGLFKWRQFEPEVILLAIGWYLRFSLSYRDVEELLAERGIEADHVTLWRWVQRYAPELDKRLRKSLKATNDSWRVDETYVRVKGKWRYLYRAVDSSGATLDFLLSAKQDAEAAKRFLSKALGRQNHPEPRVIHSDGHGAYPPAIAQLKEDGALAETCRHRVGPYFKNMVAQDHRAIKRRVKIREHFRSIWAVCQTLAGYEAIPLIRKGQAFGGSSNGGVVPLRAFIRFMFGFAR
jgi:transposase, IS6 family